LEGVSATKKPKKSRKNIEPPNGRLLGLLQRVPRLAWMLHSTYQTKNLLFSANYNTYKNTLKLLDKQALMYYNYYG
jgi:hypothetical protein